MREKTKKIVDKTIQIIGSKYFFWGVIVLFVLQAAWIAFSSAYPMPYDESFHIGVIKIFSHQLSPFILNQPTAYDIYGNLTHGDATIFHYLMSFPYRLVSVFTDNLAAHVIFLRMISIAMVAVEIALLDKLFKKIGIKQVFINIGMLLFVLLPIVPFLAATINYDNMLFLLTALFLIVCVDIISNKKIIWSQYIWLLIIGCFASLVKYTFLPVFAISLIYLTIVLYRRHGKRIFPKILTSFRSTSRLKLIGIITIVVATVGMFSAVYLQNIVLYGSIQPSCEKVMVKERCNKNAVFSRNDYIVSTKNARPIVQSPNYISLWVLQMADWTNMTGGLGSPIQSVARQPLPIIYTTVFLGGFIGLFSLLYSWRSLQKKSGWYFLGTVSILLVLTVFAQNYSKYIEIHAIASIQPRYFLSIVPIVIVMVIVAINFILRRSIFLKLVTLLIVLVLFTQGSGIISYILQSKDSWYWHNSKVIEANHIAKKILQPLVKEN